MMIKFKLEITPRDANNLELYLYWSIDRTYIFIYIEPNFSIISQINNKSERIR